MERLRAALDAHARDVRDLGFLPEYMLHRVPVPYTFGHDARAYDAAGVSAAATRASDPAVDVDAVRRDLASRDPAIRYWASLGITVRGRTAVAATEAALVERLADDAPGPRIAAAEALARYGTPEHRTRALATLLALAAEQEVYVALLALNSLVHIGELPADVRTAVAALPRDAGQSNQRGGSVAQTIDQIAKGLR